MNKRNNGKTKYIALLMVCGLTLSLAACGNDDYVQPYSNYDLSEYVTLGEYKGLEVTQNKIEVTDEEVQAEIKSRLAEAAQDVEKTEGTAASGDKVRIVYEGKMDGKVFEGGSTSAEGTTITLGQSGYIDGFDDGVIGMKPGESKTLELQFPEDYRNNDLAGKDVEFDVTLEAIVISEIPEYNLEFVTANSDAKTLEEYEESVKADLIGLKETTADEEMKNTLWSQVMDNSEILKYPEAEIKQTKEVNEAYYESYATQSGMETEEFISMYTGMDAEAYADYQQQYAEAIVAQEMVMYTIAKAENLTITDDEYDELLKEFMTAQGIDDEKAFEEQYGMSFEEYAGKDNIMKSFMLEKVIDFLVDNAVVTEAEAA